MAQALLPDALATGSDMAEFLYRSVPAAEYETGVEDIALPACQANVAMVLDYLAAAISGTARLRPRTIATSHTDDSTRNHSAVA